MTLGWAPGEKLKRKAERQEWDGGGGDRLHNVFLRNLRDFQR